MIRRLFGLLIRSGRARDAVVGNGLVSVASLALSVGIARTTSSGEFGQFAMALVVFTFASGAARAAFADTALSAAEDAASRTRSLQRTSLTALVVGIIILAVGLITASPYFIVLGASFHGLVCLDFLRTYDAAVGDHRRALVASAAWATTTLTASAVAFAVPVQAVTLMTAWAATGALCGYTVCAVTRSSILPIWPRDGRESSAAAYFSLDYLVGSGGSALTLVLTGFVSTVIVGALRGAGTLLGPANLIGTTARSLVIPVLARAQSDPRAELRVAARITLALAALFAPLLALMQFLPPKAGEWLLGETWSLAALVLLPLAIESLFAIVGSVPAAGHRAAFAGRRALALRASVGVPRPFIVVGAALIWGAAGAAWAMAALAAVNAVIWWVSYRVILRSRERGV